MVGNQSLISWLHFCSTNNVVLNMFTQHLWATTEPYLNWAGCHTPLPRRTRRPLRSGSPTLGKHPGTFPLDARPYVQCRRHMPRGLALIQFVTPRPQRRIAQHFRGASLLTHIISLTLSFSLRVKGLTQKCYGWKLKAYKLAPALLN